jgi:hypothetical protein
MAISTTHTKNDVTIQNCYIRVSSIGGTKNKIIAVISFSATAQSAAFTTAQIEFAPVLTGENFISQAYNHLKMLPEFSNAIDC